MALLLGSSSSSYVSDDGSGLHSEHEALALKQFTRTIGASPDTHCTEY